MLWTELHPTVQISSGWFHVILGSVTPLGDLFESPRWLGISIGDDSEMAPREQLATVAHAYRVGTIDGASGGVISGKLTAGDNNTNSGDLAFVFGSDNTADGDWSVVCGGGENSAQGNYSTVVGGNICSASDAGAFCGAGYNNNAEGEGSGLIGGSDNTTRGDYSFIGGGVFNRSEGSYSSIAGGNTNFASGESSAISGGQSNNATGPFSVVGGGHYSAARASGATASGGEYNSIESGSTFGTVGGGRYNHVRSSYAVIAGGGGPVETDSNSVLGYASTISGGRGQFVSGQYSVIGGGRSNEVSADYSVVGGGYNNSASGSYATVPGGTNCNASGLNSFAAGRNATAAHPGSFVWNDGVGDSVQSNGWHSFTLSAAGGYYLYPDSLNTLGVRLTPNSGSWTTISDSTQKTDIRDINTEAVLDRIAALRVTEWRYKTQPDATVRHISPMAQDFWNSFHLGEDSLGISTIDADGVALAAIQELAKQNVQKDREIFELKERVRSLEETIQQFGHKMSHKARN